jgi:hypothetical protein
LHGLSVATLNIRKKKKFREGRRRKKSNVTRDIGKVKQTPKYIFIGRYLLKKSDQ